LTRRVSQRTLRIGGCSDPSDHLCSGADDRAHRDDPDPRADLRRARLRARRRTLGSRDLLVSGQLIYPEARAALAAAARANRIDRSTHASAIAVVDELYAQLRIVAIDEPLARYAGNLAAGHALRGYDAVHLACALHLQGEDVLLASWDNALNAAARQTGRLIVNDAS
jgi:predicted nucleic acid-binding protein